MQKISFFIRVACLLLCCISVFATTIDSIVVEGVQFTQVDIVRQALPLQVGDNPDKAAISSGIKAVYGTGFYQDVAIKQVNGVLTVSVVENPMIRSVETTGDKYVIKKEQLESIYQQEQLVSGRPLNQSGVYRVEHILQMLYQERGYMDVQVHIDKKTVSANNVALVVAIDPGPQVRVDSIIFKGNTHLSQEKLLAVMSMKMASLWSWLLQNNLYSARQLEQDIHALINLYHAHGFLDAKVHSLTPEIDTEQHRTDIVIDIEEGAVYHVRKLEFVGDSPLSNSHMRTLVGMNARDVFDQDALQRGIKSIELALADIGYANTIVQADLSHVDTVHHQVDVQYKVLPGAPYTVGQIIFTGNYITDEAVLRRTFSQYEGALYDKSAIDKSIRRLNNTGYIKSAECQPLPMQSHAVLDLNCHIEEQLTSVLTGEMGFSDKEGFLYGFNYTQNNFLGTGNSIALEFRRSEEEKNFRIYHNWPHFTHDGVGANVSLYYKRTTPSRVNISSYHTDNVGANFGLSWPLTEYGTLSPSLGFEHIQVHTFDDTPAEIQNYLDTYGDHFNQAKLGLSWNYKNLDSTLLPTKGVTNRFIVDVAAPYNDNNDTLSYYKLQFKNSFYEPLYRIGNLGDVVLIGQTSLGYGHGLGNQDGNMPWFKNFFAGGLGTVRGYKSNSLGPQAISSEGESRPIGGNVLVAQSVGLILPQSFNEDMRWSVFVDAGNVFENTIDWNEIRYSAGFSVEWRTQIAPLVFSFGFPLHQHAGDQKDVFSFSISAGV